MTKPFDANIPTAGAPAETAANAYSICTNLPDGLLVRFFGAMFEWKINGKKEEEETEIKTKGLTNKQQSHTPEKLG